MRRKKKFKGSFKQYAAFWGQHLTGDHITSKLDKMLGVTGDKNAWVVQDRTGTPC